MLLSRYAALNQQPRTGTAGQPPAQAWPRTRNCANSQQCRRCIAITAYQMCTARLQGDWTGATAAARPQPHH